MDICLAGRPCIAASPSLFLFLDLLGKLASENPPSTNPNNLCYTTLKPDIVMLTDSQLRVVELTVPMNSLPNILAVRNENSKSSPIIAYSVISSQASHILP